MTDPRGKSGALVPVSQVGNYKAGRAARAAARRRRVRTCRASTYTPAGKEAADKFRNFSPEDNPRMRCETTSILFDWTFDGPVDRITQSGDTITLQYGQYGFTRTIHMNAEHPAKIEPSRAGHSTGRWENDVLVVDTVGFAPGVLNPPDHEQRSAARDRAFRARRERDEDQAQLYGHRSRDLQRGIHGLRHYRRRGPAVRAGQVRRAHGPLAHARAAGCAPPPLAGAAGAPGRGASRRWRGRRAGEHWRRKAAPAKSWWKFWEWWD